MKHTYKLLIYPLVKVLNCLTSSRLKCQDLSSCPHTAIEFGMEKYVYSPPPQVKYMLVLLPYVKQWCSDNAIRYEIKEGVEEKRDMARSVVQGFIRTLKPRSRGKSLKVRDYQIDAVHHALARNRCLLLSPTASGKSLIIYSIIRYFQMSDMTTLIVSSNIHH